MAIFTGTDLNDVITGGTGDDVLNGLAGRDSLDGAGGNDTLFGGSGIDTLTGGAGNDVFAFAHHPDTIIVNGPDTIFVSGDADRITDFNTNEDVIDLTDSSLGHLNTFADLNITDLSGNALVDLGSGHTLLLLGVAQADLNESHFLGIGGSGNPGPNPSGELFTGTSGDDVILDTTGSDSLAGPDDTLQGLAGNDTLTATDGDDILDGGAGDDVLDGGTDDDTYLFGVGSGHDTIDSSIAGVDAVLFGSGVSFSDLAFVRVGNDLVITLSASDTLTIINMFAANDTFTGRVDALRFADGSEFLLDGSIGLPQTGTNADESIGGGSGDDTLDGGAGNDRVSGFGGDDLLLGSAGNDTLLGSDGNDTLNGGADNDFLEGHAGDDVYLFGRGGGQDTVSSVEGGFNIVRMEPGVLESDIQFAINGSDLIITIADTGESIILTSHYASNGAFAGRVSELHLDNGAIIDLSLGLFLTGTDADDFILSTRGDDTIDGGLGDDTLTASGGDDVYLWGRGQGNDVIDYNYFNSDTDSIQLGSGITPQDVQLYAPRSGDLRIILDTGEILTLRGQSYYPHISELRFADGSVLDLINGSLITGTDSDDLLIGTPNNDLIDGGLGNDTILGNNADDYAIGGLGDDSINGGTGDDTLTGGVGNDRFVFVQEAGATDVITDFTPGEDIIDLTDASFTGLQVLTDLNLAQSGNDVLVDIGNGHTLRLLNINVSDLSEQDFDGINAANTPPEITQVIADQVAMEDQTFNLVLPQIIDQDGDAITVMVTLDDDSPLPTWLSFDEPTRTLSGTPGDPDVVTSPLTLKVTADDGKGGVTTQNFALDVQNINDKPVIIGFTNENTYIYQQGAVLVDDAITVTDVDNNTLQGAELRISNLIHEGDEILSVTDTTNITSSFDAVTGILTLQGQASVQEYETVIESLTYNYIGASYLDEAVRRVEVTVNDGVDTSDVQMTRVHVQIPATVVADMNGGRINGTTGNDVVQGAEGNDRIYGRAGDDLLHGGDNNDRLHGGSGNDHLYGDAGNDFVEGERGDDMVHGGDGDDRLEGNQGNDTLYGDAGDDRMHGGTGDDLIFGGDGSDTIVGGQGNDTITGGAGADVIYTGLTGDDVFVYNSLSDSTATETDTIALFISGSDKLDLSALGFSINNITINQGFLGVTTLRHNDSDFEIDLYMLPWQNLQVDDIIF